MSVNSEALGALARSWAADPYQEHKRPPFRAHSFDDDGRYWVVGTTCVSVLHGWHGPKEVAEQIANALNCAPTNERDNRP